MNLLNNKLLEQADFQRRIAKHNFMMTRCKKCLNTGLIKKRGCNLLYGFRKPCCDSMDKFVEKQNKEINKKIIKNAFSDLKYTTKYFF